MTGNVKTEGELHEDDVTTVDERVVAKFKEKPFSSKKDVKKELNISNDRLNMALEREFGTISLSEIRERLLREVIENGVEPSVLANRFSCGRQAFREYIKRICGDIGASQTAEDVIKEYQERGPKEEVQSSRPEEEGLSSEEAAEIVGALYLQEKDDVAERFLEVWR